MASARIDFEGQYAGGCCAQQPVQISRTKPAILDEYMPETAWNNFCDEVDQALHPLNKLRKFSGYATAVFMIAFMAVPLFVIIPTVSNFDSPSRGQPNVFAFMIGPVVAMVGLISTQCIIARKANNVLEDVKRVCDDVSKRQPRLSFHVRFERYYYRSSNDSTSSHTTNYIEVSIAGGNSYAVPLATTVEPVLPTAPEIGYSSYPDIAPGVNGGKSPAERLADLEEMKPHLLEAEYLAKRNEILASV